MSERKCKNIYHYIVKGMIILFPIILTLISYKFESASSLGSSLSVWFSDFGDLSINSWYISLITTLGFNSINVYPMNVIILFPLYLIWVYLIDLIMDCLLVIPNLFHNFLNRGNK